jgi:hypothetical protein
MFALVVAKHRRAPWGGNTNLQEARAAFARHQPDAFEAAADERSSSRVVMIVKALRADVTVKD